MKNSTLTPRGFEGGKCVCVYVYIYIRVCVHKSARPVPCQTPIIIRIQSLRVSVGNLLQRTARQRTETTTLYKTRQESRAMKCFPRTDVKTDPSECKGLVRSGVLECKTSRDFDGTYIFLTLYFSKYSQQRHEEGRRGHQQAISWERFSPAASSWLPWAKTPWFTHPQERTGDTTAVTGCGGRREVAKIASLKDSQVVVHV